MFARHLYPGSLLAPARGISQVPRRGRRRASTSLFRAGVFFAADLQVVPPRAKKSARNCRLRGSRFKKALGRPAIQDCLAYCCAALWPAAKACRGHQRNASPLPVGEGPGVRGRCLAATAPFSRRFPVWGEYPHPQPLSRGRARGAGLPCTFHALRRHAPAGPDMGPARTPSLPAALTSCIRGPPAPTPQCRTQLARTQLPCERRRDGCPGPGFTPGQPAARCGSFLGGSLKEGRAGHPPDTAPTGIPQRRVTPESILGNRGGRFNASFEAKFWIFVSVQPNEANHGFHG